MTVAVPSPHPGEATGTSPWPRLGLRWLELGVPALLAQIVLIHGGITSSRDGPWFAVLLVCSHLLLIPFLLGNFSSWGVRLLAAGLALNLAVMVANGGLMPVDHAAVSAVGRDELSRLEDGEQIPGTKNVLLSSEEINLGWLRDNMLVPLPSPFAKAVSPGDVLIATGAVVAYAEVFRRTLRWTKSEALA